MSGSCRILVIEDEPAIADTLVYALRTEGFSPEWRASGREGLAAFAEGGAVGGARASSRPTGTEIGGGGVAAGVGAGFALVILDVGLPDLSGFDVCRELRTRSSVPVLFLTARSGEIDRVVGLELGGDDYVTKPFSPREVTARVRAILRRTQAVGVGGATGVTGEAGSGGADGAGGATRLKNDKNQARRSEEVCHLLSDKLSGGPGLVVDEECKNAFFSGVKLELTRYEFRLLAVLHSRPGRVWSRDELMTRVWEDPGASLDRTVDAHIKMLRGKLRAAVCATGTAGGAGAADVVAELIQTHRGEGYSLRAGA